MTMGWKIGEGDVDECLEMAEVEKLALYYAYELSHGKIILLEFKGWRYFQLYFAHEQSNAWPINITEYCRSE